MGFDLTVRFNKYLLLLLMGFAISACGERNSPDELQVVKYKPIVMPKKLVLVKPDSSFKSLGYQESRTIIKNLQGNPQSNRLDLAILNKFKINEIDNSIRDKMKTATGDNIILNIKKEKERIAENKKSGKKITAGKTPQVNERFIKSGIDELTE